MISCINWISLLIFLSVSRLSCLGFLCSRHAPRNSFPAGRLRVLARQRFPAPVGVKKQIENKHFPYACTDKTSLHIFRGEGSESKAALSRLSDAAAGSDPALALALDNHSDASLAVANRTLAAIRSGLTFEDVFGPALPIPTVHGPKGSDSIEVEETDEIMSIAESLDIDTASPGFFPEAFGQLHEAWASLHAPRAEALRRLMELGVRRRLRRDEEKLRASITNKAPESTEERGLLGWLASDGFSGIMDLQNRIRRSSFANFFRRIPIPILGSSRSTASSEVRQINIDLVFDAVIKLFDLKEHRPMVDGLKSSREDLDRFKLARSNSVGVTVRKLMHAAQSFGIPSHPRQAAPIAAGVFLSLVPLFFNTRAGPITASSFTLIISHLMSLAYQVQLNEGLTSSAVRHTVQLSCLCGSLGLLLSCFSPTASRARVHAAVWTAFLVAGSLLFVQKTENYSDSVVASSALKISPMLVVNPDSFLSRPVRFGDSRLPKGENIEATDLEMDNKNESISAFLSEFERLAHQEDSRPLAQRGEAEGEGEGDADLDEDDEEAISRFDATDDADAEGDFSGGGTSSSQRTSEELDSGALSDDDRETESRRPDFTLHSFGSRNAGNRRATELFDADSDAREAVGDAGLLLEQELARLAETGYFDDEGNGGESNNEDRQMRDVDISP